MPAAFNKILLLAVRGTEPWVQGCGQTPSTQQTFFTTPNLLERCEGRREPDKTPEAVPKSKGK